VHKKGFGSRIYSRANAMLVMVLYRNAGHADMQADIAW
jgi:hypothetical protein